MYTYIPVLCIHVYQLYVYMYTSCMYIHVCIPVVCIHVYQLCTDLNVFVNYMISDQTNFVFESSIFI